MMTTTLRKLGAPEALLFTLMAAGSSYVLAGSEAGAVEPAVSRWAGEGTIFDGNGMEQGDYTVELERRHRDEMTVDQEVRVHIPDRETLVLRQTMEGGKRRFKIQSDGGEGGGMDLGG